MERTTIEKGINIINYAIDNNISIWKACQLNGFGETYVKNIKAVILKKNENERDVLDEKFLKLFAIYKSEKQLRRDEQVATSIKPPTTRTGSNTMSTIVPANNIKFEGKDDNATVTWNGNEKAIKRIKTLDDLLDSTDVDTSIWSVKNYIVNKWDVTSWKNGNPETVQNFQVKAFLERIKEVARHKMAAEIFKEMTKNYTPPIVNIPRNTKNVDVFYEYIQKENNLLEICIFDLHVGKLAWAGETGENYDTKIASKRFIDALAMLLYRASSFNYSKILFPVGNDFFNSDTINNTTTKGTPQDEDLRWQKTFKVGTQLLVDGINILKTMGVPVEVLVIPGNHDFERSFYMGSFLEAWFRNDDLVTVNNGASPRKYFRFGEVLLGFTHGSEEKENSLPMLMASEKESKEMWSDTKYHEWHLGHLHRKINTKYKILDKGKELSEDLGVTVRYLSSLTGTEEWHHKKGFVGNTKAADAFIWNDENGLLAHLNSNLIE